MNMHENIVAVLDFICEKERFNLARISRETTIPNPCLYRWYNGIDLPKTKNLCKLLTRFPYVKKMLFREGGTP